MPWAGMSACRWPSRFVTKPDKHGLLLVRPTASRFSDSSSFRTGALAQAAQGDLFPAQTAPACGGCRHGRSPAGRVHLQGTQLGQSRPPCQHRQGAAQGPARQPPPAPGVPAGPKGPVTQRRKSLVSQKKSPAGGGLPPAPPLCFFRDRAASTNFGAQRSEYQSFRGQSLQLPELENGDATTRNPTLPLRLSGSFLKRFAQRALSARLNHEPPRNTRASLPSKR